MTLQHSSKLFIIALLLILSVPLSAQETTDSDAVEAESTEVPAPTSYITIRDLEGYPSIDPPISLFEVVDETEDTLTISHLRGETTIPRNPERIVASAGTEEILISLGIMTAGLIAWEDLSPVVRDIAPDVVHLPVVDSGPNLEQLLELDPDLILGWAFVGGDNAEHYDLVSEIAPTVVFNQSPNLYFEDYTRQIASLFDLEDKAEEVIAEYEDRVIDLREQVQPIIGDETVSALLFFTTPWLYGPMDTVGENYVPSSYVGWLFYELELTPSEETVAFNSEGQVYAEVAGEILPEVQANHLVVFPGGYSGATEIAEAYTEYIESPIWQSLPAVEAGNVYIITGINRPVGYYTRLAAMERFADAVTDSAEQE